MPWPAVVAAGAAVVNAGAGLASAASGGESSTRVPKSARAPWMDLYYAGGDESENISSNPWIAESGIYKLAADFIWDTMAGDVPEAFEKYQTGLDDIEAMIDELPKVAQSYLAPMLKLYDYVGRKYLLGAQKSSDAYDKMEAKYDQAWGNTLKSSEDLTNLYNQSRAEYGRIKKEYKRSYDEAFASGAATPTTINIGGTKVSLPNYRLRKEFLNPQVLITDREANLTDSQANLANSVVAAQTGLLSGMGTAQANRDIANTNYLTGFGDTVDQRTGIRKDLYDVYAALPGAKATLNEARWDPYEKWPLTMMSDAAKIQAGANPVSSGGGDQYDYGALSDFLISGLQSTLADDAGIPSIEFGDMSFGNSDPGFDASQFDFTLDYGQ